MRLILFRLTAATPDCSFGQVGPQPGGARVPEVPCPYPVPPSSEQMGLPPTLQASSAPERRWQDLIGAGGGGSVQVVMAPPGQLEEQWPSDKLEESRALKPALCISMRTGVVQLRNGANYSSRRFVRVCFLPLFVPILGVISGGFWTYFFCILSVHLLSLPGNMHTLYDNNGVAIKDHHRT